MIQLVLMKSISSSNESIFNEADLSTNVQNTSFNLEQGVPKNCSNFFENNHF